MQNNNNVTFNSSQLSLIGFYLGETGTYFKVELYYYNNIMYTLYVFVYTLYIFGYEKLSFRKEHMLRPWKLLLIYNIWL